MAYNPNDPIVRRAVEISLSKGKFSIAMLQTYLGKDHNFVSGLANWLEEVGAVAPQNDNKPRDLLINSMDEFDALAGADTQIKPRLNATKIAQDQPSTISEALKNRPKDFDFGKYITVWIIVLVFSILAAMMDPISLILTAAAIIALVWNKKKQNKIAAYFQSNDFAKIKNNIKNNAKDINELNQHIEDLKNCYTGERVVKEGRSTLSSGGYNFRRPGWDSLTTSSNVHHCSLQVVENSKEQPFKYVCKYFNIEADQHDLERFEEMFNNFAAAEQGQDLLLKERNQIFLSIGDAVPEDVIKYTPNKLVEELGFQPVDLSGISFPQYIFSYVSAGGNSTAKNVVVMDMPNLEDFIAYLDSKIKWRKSVAGQRALMTSRLREKIKERDHYTCRKCGASIEKEPNLLLEIDHIMPLSKGGETTEKNLQTLCWRCNRSKGAKVV